MQTREQLRAAYQALTDKADAAPHFVLHEDEKARIRAANALIQADDAVCDKLIALPQH